MKLKRKVLIAISRVLRQSIQTMLGRSRNKIAHQVAVVAKAVVLEPLEPRVLLTTTVVAVSGDAAPDGNGVFTSLNDGFGAPVINDVGEVVFISSLIGTTGGNSDNEGIFVGDGTSIKQIARTGGAVPDDGGAFFDPSFTQTFGPPSINNNGEVAFNAIFRMTNEPIKRGIFRGDGQTLISIAQSGQQTTLNGNDVFHPSSGLNPFSVNPGINDAGQVSFLAKLLTGAGFSDDAIFMWDGATLNEVVREREALADNGSTSLLLGEPEINSNGEIAFTSLLSTPGGNGIFIAKNGLIDQVVRGGNPTPDGTGSFFNTTPTGNFEFNDNGQIAFATIVSTATGTAFDVFQGDGNAIEKIADGRILIDLNNNGQVIYFDRDESFVPVIFSNDGVTTNEIVRNGTPIPSGEGTLGDLLGPISNDQIAMNNAGQVALSVSIQSSSSNFGIFLADPDLGLLEVARKGDQLLGSTITELVFTGESENFVSGNSSLLQSSSSNGLNENGQVTYGFSLADGRTGIAIWTAPTELETDFGDAPDSYGTTLASDGARHTFNSSLSLGAARDADADGQPSANANGDDLDNSDDEDGVVFDTVLRPGETSQITVTASASSKLDAWIDFNANGVFDTNEQIFDTQTLFSGSNTLNVSVPDTATLGDTYARFRISTAGGLEATGTATNGEVEDYKITIEPEARDYGDAPDSYNTLQASNGASHKISDLFLGSSVDADNDGQPGNLADGDDDDGVVFDTALVAGQEAQVTVTASGTGRLDAWIDFNADGVFQDSEQIFDNQLIEEEACTARSCGGGGGGRDRGSLFEAASATSGLTFNVPADAVDGNTIARFRLSSAGNLEPNGPADDGEVEDYSVSIDGLVVQDFDFGDAPDSYATLLASDGARHVLGGGLLLGSGVDIDSDGQPSPSALGDDTADGDDEDGVSFALPMTVGASSQITVTASGNGLLDAWIDFNANGVFDADEQIFVSHAVSAGSNALTANVPANATLGSTLARFRLSSAGGLAPTGLSADGEVEDYEVVIADAPVLVPQIKVMGNGIAIVDGQTAAIDFGSVVQSDSVKPMRTFTVSNDGDAPLTTSGVTLPSGFVMGNDLLDNTIGVGNSDTFNIVLESALAGLFSGQVSIQNNDANHDPFTFLISGQVTSNLTPADATDGFIDDFENATPLANYALEGTVAGVDVGGSHGIAINLSESSDAMLSRSFVLANDVASVSFDFRFANPGDGDRLRLHVNGGLPVFDALGTDVGVTDFASTGQIDLSSFAGQTVSLNWHLLSANAVNAQVLIDNIMIENTVVPVPQFITVPANNKGRIQYQDADGDTVRVTIKKGTGFVKLPMGGVGDAAELVLQNTSSKTTVAVSVKGPGGNTVIGAIQVEGVDGSLKSFTGKTVDLMESFKAGGAVGRLTLRSVLPGQSSIVMGGDANDKPAKISLGSITDLDFQTTMPINQFKATQWVQSQQQMLNQLNGTTIKKLSITGDKKNPSVLGDFEADINAVSIGSAVIGHDLNNAMVTLSQNAASGPAIAKFIVKGATINSHVSSRADVKQFITGLFLDSSVRIGVDPAVAGLPDASADFDIFAQLGKFLAKGIKGDARPTYSGSNLAAASMPNVVIKEIDSDNGGIGFGIATNMTRKISLVDESSRRRIRHLSDLDASPLNGDFEVRLFA